MNLRDVLNGQNRILLGVHKTKDPAIFDGYLGDGVYAGQPSTFMYPKTPFQFAVKKYGTESFRRATLFTFDNETDAYSRLDSLFTEAGFIGQEHIYNVYPGHGRNTGKIYQFGDGVKCWDSLDEACDFYGYPKGRFDIAATRGYKFLGSWWSYDPECPDGKPGEQMIVYYLYSANGRLLREFYGVDDISAFLQANVKDVNDAVKYQRLVDGRYYVSRKLADKMVVKPRAQLAHERFFVYQNGEFSGLYIGKEVMKVINLHSWAKIKNIMTTRNGWYKDFYLSHKQVDEIPERPEAKPVRVDVYGKTGDFIETMGSAKEVREKYGVTSAKLKNIQRGNKYFGDYVFKWHSK